jgi:hypothetical protein
MSREHQQGCITCHVMSPWLSSPFGKVMERSIEIFALVHLVTMGISHIVKRDAWAEFFIVLAEKGRTGVFLHGFLSLWFGSVIAGFYRVWDDAGVALTTFGWLMVLKALHCFLFPDAALRSLRRVSVETSWKFIPAGVLYLAVACAIAFRLWRNF